MKRCPECRRDCYDDTLSFCLEDGTPLVYGMSADEPATAILSEPGAIATGFPASESSKRDQFHSTDQTVILRTGAETEPRESSGELSEKRSYSAHRAAKPREKVGGRQWQLAGLLITVLILIGGFFGYRYFTPTKQIESIAVMPFVNESGNADIEYLSEGMTETLIKSLSQLPNLNVKARSTVFRYKGKETDTKTIGNELNVQAILNGRVVQRGDQIKLSLELLDAETENVIWTDQYDRKSTDLVSLQNEIARDVSSKLKLKLSGADEQKLARNYTTDPEAYRLYLQGRFYWNKRAGSEFQKSESYFRQSIEKDPNFALGYVGLADYYGDKERDKAKESVNRALALDENLADAHGTLGYQYMLDYDWARSEKHLTRARELDPNNLEVHRWNGQRLMMLGRYDEAFESYGRAIELDPNSSPVHFIYGSCLVASGQLDKGIEYLENAVRKDLSFIYNHSQLSFAYRMKNNYARASEERAMAQDLLGETENAKLTRESFAKGGRDGFLREMIRQGVNPDGVTGGMRTASSHALLGEYDKALSALENATARGDFWLFQIKYDPAYEPLRGDSRFQALVKKFDPPQ